MAAAFQHRSGQRLAMVTHQAVVLVGGKGTRLGALTANTPKPLMPLDDKTVFLDEVLFDIARHGFDDIILAAGHFGEQFVERYHEKSLRGAQLRVVVEPYPCGTGGALKGLEAMLAPTFLFVNGDTAFDINLRRLDALLGRNSGALAALALRRVNDAGRYGSVTLDQDRILAFHEKRAQADSAGGLINGGIGLFRREIVDYIDTYPCSIETQVYPLLCAQNRLCGGEFSGYFIDIGLLDTLNQARADLPLRRYRPAVFFDRDGVINQDKGYTHKVEDLVFIHGAVAAIREVNDCGALAIVVTNQAGVARGLYGPDAVQRFHQAMAEQLARQGAHIDAFYSCMHHPDAVVPAYWHPNHPDRKPNPGMILRAMAEWPIDPGTSQLIGDMASDIEAARQAGVAGHLFDGGDLARFTTPLLAPIKAALAPLRSGKTPQEVFS